MAEDTTYLEASAAVRDALVAGLVGPQRRHRQEAAHRLAALARSDPRLIAEITDVLVEALSRPEAQTRWECLDALSEVAAVDPEAAVNAFEGAEDALFDGSSAAVRLAAFRFLARYGAVEPRRSVESWRLMSDAIQCYHGDSEYREMLVCLRDFVQGSIDDGVRAELAERMRFDAKNARGYMRAYSQEICDIVEEG